MSIVKVGRDEYLVRCNVCGDETLQSFNSKTEARQFVENNDEGWVDDFDNGFTCPSCREHKFDNMNNKYYKKSNVKNKTIIIDEDRLNQYLKDRDKEICKYYEMQYEKKLVGSLYEKENEIIKICKIKNMEKLKNLTKDLIIDLFNYGMNINNIFLILRSSFNISNDYINEIIEEELYRKKYNY